MNGKIESLSPEIDVKKEPNGNLKVKNTTTEMINSLDGLDGTMEMIEETASKPEDRQIFSNLNNREKLLEKKWTEPHGPVGQ